MLAVVFILQLSVLENLLLSADNICGKKGGSQNHLNICISIKFVCYVNAWLMFSEICQF